MLMPKRVKHRKQHRRVNRRLMGAATRGTGIDFGEFGLISEQNHFITSRQIEAARIAMTRKIKRGGKVWIRLFPDVPVTKKAAETRMGSGKGTPEFWVASVRRGMVLFEISGVAPDLAEAAMKLAASKLPIRAKFVSRAEA